MSEIEIDAPPALVWQVLLDLEQYRVWNPFTIEVRSGLQPGDRVDMQVVLSRNGPPRRQQEIVSRVEPQRALCWGVRFGFPGALRAERCQTLEPLAGGTRTRYRTVDRLHGWLVPLVMRLYGQAMQRGFNGVARGLRRRAESLARQ